MARPLRIEYPGAVYHIVSRGNRRQDIFSTDADRERFLSIFRSVLRVQHWFCHAYCLMDNHYHPLVETPEANLSVGMRNLNGIYTQGYNKAHRAVGHVFQGRFSAHVIEKESYLFEAARYIVLNPVRARLVAHPRDWRWSSYRMTAGEIPFQRSLLAKRLLMSFSSRPIEARRCYRAFVEQGIGGASPFAQAKHGTILGSPQFVSRMWERMKEAESNEEIVKDERMIGRPSMAELFCDIETTAERNDAIRQARIRAGYSVSDIARHLFIHRTTVSKILNKN